MNKAATVKPELLRPMAGKLKRRTRIMLADRQVCATDITGQAGVYAVLYMSGSADHPTIDLRYFRWSEARQRNVSTIRGVIFDSMDDALAAAKAILELVEVARGHYGLKDELERVGDDPELRTG